MRNTPILALALPLALALALAACLAACPEAPVRRFERQLEPRGDQPPTTFGAFEPDEIAESLHGDWIVEQRRPHGGASKALFAFSIHGDRIRVVDKRYARERVLEGALVIRSATGFGVEPDDGGVTYYYSFVDTGEQVFMGMGAAIALRDDERFVARLGAWEELRYDGERCSYVRTFGADIAEEEVDCGFRDRKPAAAPGARKGAAPEAAADAGVGAEPQEDEERERVFTYRAEDPFRPGKQKTFELIVAGRYLVSRELADSVARRLPWEDAQRAEGTEGAADAGPVDEPDAAGDPVAESGPDGGEQP